MKKALLFISSMMALAPLGYSWGFFAHRHINRLAVFTLPPPMIKFYKKNIEYLSERAVDPDRRRYAIEDEAPRHYIDLDVYGDSALQKMPRQWEKAVELYSEDTLKKYGILPWHIMVMKYRLTNAFLLKDPRSILKLSAELGHYIADANVPLHTTVNYNGQLTGQKGIHAFWETRLPELFFEDYDFFVGKATYLDDPLLNVWDAIAQAHMAVDSVLDMERALSEKIKEDKKYGYETRGQQTVRVYSKFYSRVYHSRLHGMVERQMRRSVKMIADFWYTCWVDAGQPDLTHLEEMGEEERERRWEELRQWKERVFYHRLHEAEDGH